MSIKSLFALAICVTAGVAVGADGDLDPSFGLSGIAYLSIDLGGTKVDAAADLLVASDGKVYVVGNAATAVPAQNNAFLMRLNANDGALDLNFGKNGKFAALEGTNGDFVAHAAAFDANGNLVVAGAKLISGADTDFMVCRVAPDGNPVDFSAVGANCVSLPFDFGGSFTDEARDVVVLQDGRIVLVGSATGDGDREYGALLVLASDGTFLNAPVILPDDYNRIGFNAAVAVPTSPSSISIAGYRVLASNPNKSENFLVTANLDAQPGTEFDGGIVFSPTPDSSVLTDLVLSDDGMPIAVGRALQGGKSQGYLTYGLQPPAAFLDAGDVTEFERIVRLPGNRVAVLGQRNQGGTSFDIIAARYRYDAATCAFVPDTAFAPNGWTVVPLGLAIPPGYSARGLAARDGRLTLATTLDTGGGNFDVGMARLGGDTIFIDGFERLELASCN